MWRWFVSNKTGKKSIVGRIHPPPTLLNVSHTVVPQLWEKLIVFLVLQLRIWRMNLTTKQEMGSKINVHFSNKVLYFLFFGCKQRKNCKISVLPNSKLVHKIIKCSHISTNIKKMTNIYITYPAYKDAERKFIFKCILVKIQIIAFTWF